MIIRTNRNTNSFNEAINQISKTTIRILAINLLLIKAGNLTLTNLTHKVIPKEQPILINDAIPNNL